MTGSSARGPQSGGSLRHAGRIIRDVGPRWALTRAGELLREEGLGGVLHRGRRSIDTRRSLEGRSAALRAGSAPGSSAAFRRSVLIVSDIAIPQCRFYRVDQKVEVLRNLGLHVRVASHVDLDECLDAVQVAGTVILYRVAWSRNVEAVVREARRVDATVVFETDDAVYRRDLLEADQNVLALTPARRRGVMRGADLVERTMREAHLHIASTGPLADDVARFTGRPAVTIPNSIDSRMVTIAQGIRDEKLPRTESDSVTVFYGSGSRAHDEDFAVALPGLTALLRDRPRARLVVAGHVSLPGSLTSLGDRVRRIDPAPFGSYLRDLAQADICLAPLLPSPFNQFKSDIKFLEASLVGVASVVSPTVYGRSVSPGETALVAERPDDWYDALTSLVDDPDRRASLGASAARSVEDRRIDHSVPATISDAVTALGVDVPGRT